MSKFVDRLTNVMSGMGTTADRRVYAGYNFVTAQPQEVEAAYRTSWLMRKIVDLPPRDMTRNWRSWQTDRNTIGLLEKEEKRLKLKAKIRRALVLARLWGGAAIIIGVKGKGENPEQELLPDGVTKGSLEYLHVFARSQLTAGQMIADPKSPWFGHPQKYTIQVASGHNIDIHPSRVVAFIGQAAPEGSTMQADWFWGDPLYQSILTAIQNADLAQDGFASLIDEAKIDIVKIPDLMETWASDEYEDRLMQRLSAAKMGKTNWRTLLLDGNEEWEQREVTWTGIPDIIVAYLQIVAGAADIPITRLLGQSPKGLQSTGEGEEKDYQAKIEADQDELLCPALERIDEFLIRSAIGDRPEDIWYKFNSLARLTPKDAADVELKRSQAVKQYSDAALFPEEALSTIAKNAITESGAWPGSEIAFEKAEAAGLDPPAANPADVMTPEEQAAAKAKAAAAAANDGARPHRIMDAALADGEPRSLYVSRRLLNADELIRWAKKQGFKTTQPADQMHVTIAFSRQPVDWMKVGEDWSSDENGRIRVKPGGPRTVERLGDKGAVGLMFRNDGIEYRHERIHAEETGAQWDWPEYRPHVTITWEAPADLDLTAIEPYQGPLVFGPEIFAEVVDDWESTIKES